MGNEQEIEGAACVPCHGPPGEAGAAPVIDVGPANPQPMLGGVCQHGGALRVGREKHWNYDPARIEQFNTFRNEFLAVFQTFLVPVIQLTKSASKEAVCRVFEKVNTGGVPLTAFELVTATYAADGYDLRADWFGPKSGPEAGKGRWRRLVTSGPIYSDKERDAVLAAVEPNDFLQCVSLLHTQDVRQRHVAEGKAGQPPAISCTRQAILDMRLDAYEAWAARAEAGFKRAREFLWNERIYSSGDLPYRTQLVPLAAIIASRQLADSLECCETLWAPDKTALAG